MAIQKRVEYSNLMPFSKRIAVACAKDVIWIDYDSRYGLTLTYLSSVYSQAVRHGIVFG